MKRSAAACCLVLVLRAGAALAQAPDHSAAQARRAFDEGVVAYREGRFEAARAAFEASYALSPNPYLLFNIGKANADARRPAAARVAFERYVREVGNELKPERVEEVNAALLTLRAQTSEVVVQVEPAGPPFELLLDGERAESPAIVDPGPHVLVARRGAEQTQTELRAEAGQRHALTLRFAAPEPAVAAPPEPSAPPPPDRRRSYLVPTVAWVGTAALATGAVVATVLWAGAGGELSDLKERETTRAELEQHATRTNVLGGVALGLGVGAVAGAALATWLTVRTPASTTSRWQPTFGPGAVGARVTF